MALCLWRQKLDFVMWQKLGTLYTNGDAEWKSRMKIKQKLMFFSLGLMEAVPQVEISRDKLSEICHCQWPSRRDGESCFAFAYLITNGSLDLP